MTDNNPSRKECFVSVVTVLPGQVPDRQRLKAILDHLTAHFTDYEIVIIQNGYPSGTGGEELLLRSLNSIRYLQLSSAVYPDVALAAGVENAIGDYVVILSDQDPIEVIAETVELCQNKADVVIGISERPSSLIYRVARAFIRKALLSIDYDLPRGATTLRCLSRRAVNAVIQTGRFHHQFFMRIQKTGFATAIYRYDLLPGNISPSSLIEGIENTLRLFVFNSTRPLRWISMLGLLGSVMAFVFATYSIVINFFKNKVVEGWTTLVFFNSFLFMVMFVMMAFFGEYLGRLLDESSDRHDYAVAFEKTSNAPVGSSRINVLRESTGTHDAAVSVRAGERSNAG